MTLSHDTLKCNPCQICGLITSDHTRQGADRSCHATGHRASHGSYMPYMPVLVTCHMSARLCRSMQQGSAHAAMRPMFQHTCHAMWPMPMPCGPCSHVAHASCRSARCRSGHLACHLHNHTRCQQQYQLCYNGVVSHKASNSLYHEFVTMPLWSLAIQAHSVCRDFVVTFSRSGK